MSARTSQTAREIAAKISARKKILRQFLYFAIPLVQKHGKLISRDVSSGHTNIERKLSNFHHFTFILDTGMTEMGGNHIKVFYHPNRESESAGDLVLQVYWQAHSFDTDECRVDFFRDDGIWQPALLWVAKNKDRIISGELKEKERKASARALSLKEQQAIERLREEAKRLGV